jgi:hypothetical protein
LKKKEGCILKRKFYHLFLVIFLSIISLSIANELPVLRVQAATSKDLAGTYLNSVHKNLYVGIRGKKKFDFNIKQEMQKEGSTYFWYVAEDKGDSYAVTIDSETGIVTARLAGTAYIRCRITLADQTVYEPEAEVSVFNNITGVSVSNIPENGRIAVGYPTDFDYTVLNTTAGKKALTKGIVRFEIANDTAAAGTASDEGVIVPQQEGSFDIRAVCFQSIDDYNSWLKNKVGKAGNITAASEWATINVLSTTGVATTLEQLMELLKSDYITQITFTTELKQEITIPEGDYSDKTLLFITPNTSIINYGTFKLIRVEYANSTSWNEYGTENSMELYSCNMNLFVADKAGLKNLVFGSYKDLLPDSDTSLPKYRINKNSALKDTSGNYISLANYSFMNVSGSVDHIDITAPTRLVLEGKGTVGTITVEDTANGTMMATYIASDFSSDADIIITFYSGSEKTNIAVSTDSYAGIENLSNASMAVHFGNGYVLTMPKYAIKITDGVYELIGIIDAGSVIKVNPTNVATVAATVIKKGEALWCSQLSGTFYNNSVKVEGTLSWVTPLATVYQNGYYQWIFTPTDKDSYNIVFGTVVVEVQ